VDLHGAPGSQNGFDNSGQKKSFPQWQTDKKNVDRTVAVIKTIASMFKDMTGTVPTIAPLNEPAGFFGDEILKVTKQYWLDSYDAIRHPYGSPKESNTVVMIHDAFQPADYWKNFMPSPQWEGVIMDTHVYQMFSVAENQRSNSQHI
jgi:glucan 1,3-beta-glucosidase